MPHDWNSFTHDDHDVGMFHSRRFESKTIRQCSGSSGKGSQAPTMHNGWISKYKAVWRSVDDYS